MKITKTDEYITHSRIAKTITLEINDKGVRIDYWSIDGDDCDYENDYTINEEDLKELTDEEKDTLDEYIGEFLTAEIGHLVDIKE